MGSSQTASQRPAARPVDRQSPRASSQGRSCDLCCDDRFERIAEWDRHGGELPTAVCTQCGLVAHLDIPSDEELVRFYAQEYRQQYHGETTPSVRRLVRAWANGERIYRQLANHVQRGDRVFEVGAGIGCTLKIFEQQGCQATGVEPHEGFRDFSRRQLRADVAAGDLAELPQMPPQDMVLLVHVIEHLRSPSNALDRIHGLVKPGGLLYVECPNLAAPFARRSQLFHFAHIHNFTPVTLSMLAEKCGFTVERQFSTDDDPNLQMLLKRVETRRLEIQPQSYPETLASLSRYNLLTYHLRYRYLSSRLRKLLSYAGEHLFAKRRARQILASCSAPSHSSRTSMTRG